ncbi:hypothetical protein DCAR_0830806 [Daucus carota subsp. sativus]|uniref:Uncharacterized protein n=1 Tax=Daucus carota subsp. sativus TaxID=79200 RepID=A0A175YAS0_DAUCS|nr:hypothetical protein DCAR_0830806 [Daucus carota subsp. sativus]
MLVDVAIKDAVLGRWNGGMVMMALLLVAWFCSWYSVLDLLLGWFEISTLAAGFEYSPYAYWALEWSLECCYMASISQSRGWLGLAMATYTRFSVGTVGYDVEHLPCSWDAHLDASFLGCLGERSPYLLPGQLWVACGLVGRRCWKVVLGCDSTLGELCLMLISVCLGERSTLPASCPGCQQ